MHFFQEFIERKNTNSVKWDAVKTLYKSDTELLPMWVADMDFRPPTAVIEALQERITHGVFGYTQIPDSTHQAIKDWYKNRQNFEIETEWITYSSGVVPSIGKTIQAFTEPGENVVVQSPVYTPFFSMVKDNGRNVVNVPLHEADGKYSIDFEALEEAFKNDAKLFLLCSPHNPVGRVWTREELHRIGLLCVQYDVILVSDEIHGDLVFEPHKQIPVASISQEIANQTITLIAPSKTFNLAGLQASAIITPNKKLRSKLQKIDRSQGFFTLNLAGIAAMEAAYSHGEEWLTELLDYLHGNAELVKSFIRAELPELSMELPEATYLLWIDFRKLGLSDEEIMDRLIKKGKLALNDGKSFGEGGSGFMRMNIACPRDTVAEGLKRLKLAVRG
ncbi:MalY/PatB family protein [Paenalkalicoccus suaedae]